MGLFVALRRPAPLHGRETLLTAPGDGVTGGAAETVPPASPPRASGPQRLADGFALGLIAGGAALFFYARYKLQLLASDQITRVEGHWAVEQFMRWRRLSEAGLWTAGVGLALAVGLALWQWRRNSSRSRS